MPEIVKIRCIETVLGIYAEYRPQKGKIYDAIVGESRKNGKKPQKGKFAIVKMLDKSIVLREGEFEIVGV